MRTIAAVNQKVQFIENEIPMIKPSYLLLRTLYSVISPGTEFSLISSSKDSPISLGYSAVGVVEGCGEHTGDFKKGDLVACYGAPYVHHSEYLSVPVTLCSKVPSHVDPKEAAFGGIGAIAIHALRVAHLQFGETVVIVGLGLLGQMIAKIADAALYNVIAFDINRDRVAMLTKETKLKCFTNMEEMEAAIDIATNSYGTDAVLLCAGGKRSPLTKKSLDWIRNKGKVVIVGDIEPDFPREPMFVKEAQILISRAGGPGRYDTSYERNALDYPYGFVRWTEGRNVAEYIRLVSENRIDVKPFITDEISFEEATNAYNELIHKKNTALTQVIHY